MKYKKIRKNIILFFFLLLFAVLFLSPFLMMVSTSFKTIEEVFSKDFSFIPKIFHPQNYKEAITVIPYLRYTFNSLLIAVLNIVGQILVSPLVAYSISKIDWKGRRIIFPLIMATMLIPYTVTMIPLFKIWMNLGLTGTPLPLIIPAFFGYPFYIIIMRQFFMTIPNSLIEAAHIDGCSHFKTYIKIILPLTKPALSTVAIFTFLFTWSDFLGPLIYLNKKTQYTLSLGLQAFINEHSIDWTLLMAAATLFTIPVILMFFFFQRFFIEGISTSGIK